LPVTTGWRRWLLAGRGRWLGIGFALVYGAMCFLPDPGPIPGLRHAGFDTYQTLFPRKLLKHPVVIVDIDDASLARIGQWPWPRDRMATLVDRLAARKPAVIALDVLFSEPDRTSPELLHRQFLARDPALAERLRQMPGNDALFADALRKAPVVLGLAASDETTDSGMGFAPARVIGPMPPLREYRGAIRNLDQIDAAASGRGLFNSHDEQGVVRQMPLLAMVAGQPLLSLPMECFRVAAGEAFFAIDGSQRGHLRLSIGDLVVPAQADGSVWLHFAGHDPARYVSAVDVLEGSGEALDIEGKIVLVGVTGLGLVDQPLTPSGERMPGVEVHAEVIENIFEGALLQRPEWSRLAEALAFLALAALAIIWVPRTSPSRGSLLFLVSILVLAGGGVASFHGPKLLLDPLTPLLGIACLQALLVFSGMMLMDIEHRHLAARLAIERDLAARAAGELEAARRIQVGMLPRPEIVLADERRVELFAYMHPAREVGGDLYDFFHLDRDRLFVMVGDVAGKGLAAALFMSVSKAITKSTSLRGRIGLDRLMAIVDRELSRDNPDELFVTMMALVIDLDSGRIEYCNAGHEPLLLVRGDGDMRVLDEAGGPPLCALDSYLRTTAEAWLQPGDLLVLLSDGITEAMSAGGQLYGRAALKASLQPSAGDVAGIGQRVLDAVKAFEQGSDPVDDQTLLLLRWRGQPLPSWAATISER